MADQSMWPAHLRDDAPHQRCGRCGRRTWSVGEFGGVCGMRQPDGQLCAGRLLSAGEQRREAAYVAVYEVIAGFGDTMPRAPVNRNAMIWRAVNAALHAYGEPGGSADA